MTRLTVKILLCFFCLFSAGCAAEKKTDAAVEEEQPKTLKELSDEVSSLIIERNWSGFVSLISDSKYKEDEKELLHSQKDLKVVSAEEVYEDSGRGFYLILDSGTQQYEAAFRTDAENNITAFGFAGIPALPETESSDDFTEEYISIGTGPKISGILTLPTGKTDAPVAVLMPETIYDGMNASGSDLLFRRDLAHALAEEGIASVRFDMRTYADPLLYFASDPLSLERSFFNDFAYAVHSLDKYPVSSSSIIYIGHGVAGTLGYDCVYHHFEITGGLVLLNAPFADGISLLRQMDWLDKAVEDDVRDALEKDEVPEMISGYPSSYWKEWKNCDPLIYTRYVRIPILIMQGEDDTLTLMSDYNSWKSQKGSNVTMKSYPDLGHHLRDEDWEISDDIVSDIAAWFSGKDINKVKKRK